MSKVTTFMAEDAVSSAALMLLLYVSLIESMSSEMAEIFLSTKELVTEIPMASRLKNQKKGGRALGAVGKDKKERREEGREGKGGEEERREEGKKESKAHRKQQNKNNQQ